MTSQTLPYSIAQMIRDRAIELGDNPVFSYEGLDVSYAELNNNSNQAANALLGQGIKEGDRIAFLGKNSPTYFELIAAAAKISAVIVPINWRLAGPELIYVLNDCQAELIFVEAEFYVSLAKIQPSLVLDQRIYLLRGKVDNVESYEQWRNTFSDLDPKLDGSADNDIVQLYTSGTTGKPKGAVLTSRMLLALRGQDKNDVVEDWQRYKQGESGLLAMPCFHVGGTSFGLGIIFSGAHAVVLPEYDPNQILDLIEQYRVGKVFMVPAALQILMNNPKIDTADVSSLKHIYYGASPIPLDLMREAMTLFGCGFVQMYGMTESGGTIVALPPEDHDPDFNDPILNKKMSSVGKPLSGVELKVVDEEGSSMPTGAIGEIATRSVKNIKRYWNLPEMTQEAIDADGWLLTGDAGYLDEDGYLYIQDRVKDMIITGGENVYPAEVENAIFSHEGVSDVAVIGVPDDTWGEAIKAIVVVKKGSSPNAQSIIDFARTRIASYKCPKSVDFISVLPRNTSGKVLRRELRKPYWKGKNKAVN